MDLNLVHLLFNLETADAGKFVSALFNGLRRFDQFFRQTCCELGVNECYLCNRKSDCSYRSVFAQELSNDPDVVRRHQKPPLPFAFKISQIEHSSSSIELSLVTVGSAINHLSVFNRAVRQLITAISGQYPDMATCISGVYCLDYQSVRHKLGDSFSGEQGLVVLSSQEIMKNTVEAEKIRLVLKSPLRLLAAGSMLRSMDFSAFLRSQLRRCSSLFAYYGDGELEIDFSGLATAVGQVKCINDGIHYSLPAWSRHSSQAGLLGTSEFGRIVPGILPLLTLGSYLNAGKGASYALGAYCAESV